MKRPSFDKYVNKHDRILNEALQQETLIEGVQVPDIQTALTYLNSSVKFFEGRLKKYPDLEKIWTALNNVKINFVQTLGKMRSPASPGVTSGSAATPNMAGQVKKPIASVRGSARVDM